MKGICHGCGGVIGRDCFNPQECEQITRSLADQALTNAQQDDRIIKLEYTIENLQSVMVAAAEEIQEHWAAHCDKEGYGPANLMHRLEKGIAANYPGYKPGAFAELEERNKILTEALNIIEQRDYAAMLKVVPSGIVHRADTYNTADQFEDTGSYEEYARYTGPAQRALESKFIQTIIQRP